MNRAILACLCIESAPEKTIFRRINLCLFEDLFRRLFWFVCARAAASIMACLGTLVQIDAYDWYSKTGEEASLSICRVQYQGRAGTFASFNSLRNTVFRTFDSHSRKSIRI
ncbi:hypothetical protein M758_9G189700 [Ceratodon purpureus]|uniref:Uncharacterized protein n=1 Tax=Ceratodon purpureus TaxID=3225 RepID=A0A8T0GZ49_CERPU|nr:hypothetical protein KC19_9G192100 [Ceratodon purpureus]KAG0607056.1 hypothetical protein M758_9G189700 [Ceratodon purpureus]